MSIRVALVISYAVLVAAGVYLLMRDITGRLEKHYRESIEETLVDAAEVLAAVIGATLEEEDALRRDSRAAQSLADAFRGVRQRRLQAVIYGFIKERVDLAVYITDTEGIVVFHSESPAEVGRDYSRWNDVYLTLQGKYGARSTRVRPKDSTSSVLHVAAPLFFADGRLAGVVTVAKPMVSSQAFIAEASRRMAYTGVLAAGMVVAAALLATVWLTGPLERLTIYARAIRDGARPPRPDPGGAREIRELGDAFEEMRDALEGKAYVERYVQGLTHELKSPVAGIRGAAELLDEEMPPERRRKFLDNIRREAARIQALVDRLLELASVEARKTLERTEPVNLAGVLRDVAAEAEPLAEAREVECAMEAPPEAWVAGDRLLLQRAVGNLVRNAIEFAPAGGKVRLALSLAGEAGGRRVAVIVEDNGPGIPDYALPRIFERFYSLPRPDTQAKSTGLGLAFAREVAHLHRGSLAVRNRAPNGVEARLEIPELIR